MAKVNSLHHIDATTTNRTAWIVCLPAALFFFYEFAQMNMLNTIVTLPLAGISLLQQLNPAILFFLLGICTSIQVVGYSYVIELNSKTLASTAMGFVSVLLFIGSASLQPIFGWLMECHWSGVVENQIPIYTLSNYQFALGILPIAAIMSFIIALLLPKVVNNASMAASIKQEERMQP